MGLTYLSNHTEARGSLSTTALGAMVHKAAPGVAPWQRCERTQAGSGASIITPV